MLSARQVVAVIGYPLKHSLSPVFQQAAFDAYRLPVTYEAWEVPPASLAAVLTRVRQSDCLGINITIPHKEAVIPYLDCLDDLVRQVGAVNTVVNRSGVLWGYNTDGPGFLRALAEVGVSPAGQVVLVVGAGGAARAVVCALARAGAERVLIANRTPERARALVALAAGLGQAAVVVPWEPAALVAAGQQATLIVNCTSVGLRHTPTEAASPLPAAALHPDALVYDLIYNPAETVLLRQARERGARTLNGLSMLLYQGALAFELWTGRPAPVETMRACLEAALARRG